MDQGVVGRRWRAHLAEQSLDHLVSPLVGPQEQVAERGEPDVTLRFGALAANPGLAEHLEYGLCFSGSLSEVRNPV